MEALLRVNALAAAGTDAGRAASRLTLDWERRQRSRLRARLDDGREVALLLPRGTRLRDGDVLCADDGTLILVHAAPEQVSCVEGADAGVLMRACYHLANRHVPVQIDASRLWYRHDHVLDDMLRGFGLAVTHALAPFEAEAGAYAHHADHRDAVDGSPSDPAFRDTLFAVHGRSADAIPGVARSRNAGSDGDLMEYRYNRRDHDSHPADDLSSALDDSLLSLLQLASGTLPVGSFAYSQGLEQAVELVWVRNEQDAANWILGLLREAQSRQEVPLFARLHRAWQAGDAQAVARWNARAIAMRDTAEARAEERDTGAALARLLSALEPAQGVSLAEPSYLAMYALAAVRWRIALEPAACGWLWSWCQQQTAAAIKLVPLGQTAGQRILRRALAEIPAAVECGLALADDDIGYTPSGLALAGVLHERQYTRLFLS